MVHNYYVTNVVIHNAADTIIKVSIKEENKIYISIEDNGKGIGEEELMNPIT
ncbi:ATP-binding protein [Clostridium sp. DJ247]|uniref:ATP-binding protein n=1 Tax=Clostridium sp. DJ247 TaxID=2726188 RepID=UPI001629E1D8|nr:ATP-binding protein [Clostridium sp. DJ247]MBC2581738.1 ATP-binding protein [Clostridium sp. DJ247]